MPSTDVLKSLRRLGSFPLDESTVFHNEAELDAYYMEDSPVRGENVYDGQICYVKRGNTLDSTFVYILRLNPKTNKFEKVRLLTEDNCTIEIGNLYSLRLFFLLVIIVFRNSRISIAMFMRTTATMPRS